MIKELQRCRKELLKTIKTAKRDLAGINKSIAFYSRQIRPNLPLRVTKKIDELAIGRNDHSLLAGDLNSRGFRDHQGRKWTAKTARQYILEMYAHD